MHPGDASFPSVIVRLGRAVAAMLLVCGGQLVLGAAAQEQGSRAPQTFKVQREPGLTPGLAFKTGLPEKAFEPVDYDPADEAAWAAFEDAANDAAQRLRDAHIFSALRKGFTPIPVQPINKSGPEATAAQYFPADFGQFTPPDVWETKSNIPRADVNWVRSFTKRVEGPDEQTFIWRDPYTLTAYAVAEHGMLRLVSKVLPIPQSIDDPTGKPDAVGNVIFRSAALSLALYAAEALTDPIAEPGTERLDLYHYAAAFTGPGDGSASGPTPIYFLAHGQSWSSPWGGISDDSKYESTSAFIGIFNSILAHRDVDAFVHIFTRPWPMPDASGKAPENLEWIDWLDEGIKSAPDSLSERKGYSAFVSERGLAGAYVTALSDAIGLSRRVVEYAPDKPLPEILSHDYHVRNIFAFAPCQVFEVNLKQAVHDADIEIPQVATRCIKVRYTGPTYGKKERIPPISISAYSDGYDGIAYDTLLLATAAGERTGISVEDATAHKAVKTWTVPFEPDVPDGNEMTLAFANVAPVASETVPISVHLSFGISVTGAISTLSTYVNTAPPDEACSPTLVQGPDFAGAVPFPGIASERISLNTNSPVRGELANLVGLIGFGGEDVAEAQLPALFCIEEMRSLVGIDPLTNASAARSGMCLPEIMYAQSAYGQLEKSGPRLRDMSINFSGESSLSRPGKLVGQLEWNDPSLPVFPKTRNAMGPDDRTDDPGMMLQGVLSLQKVSETRIRGRIDLVPTDELKTCGKESEGKVTIVFDEVAALPEETGTALVYASPLSMVGPKAWSMMPADARAKLKATSRRDAPKVSAGGAAPGVASDCNCSCDEFADPVRSDVCRTRCEGYAAQAPSCAVESAVKRGESRQIAQKRLQACRPSCGDLMTGDPICRDAFPEIVKTCQSDVVSEREISCYVDLLTRNVPSSMRALAVSQVQKSVDAMNEVARREIIREQIESQKTEGNICP